MEKKFNIITIDGVDYDLGGNSNVDIHIEDDTLVINTDGTSSGSGGTSENNTPMNVTVMTGINLSEATHWSAEPDTTKIITKIKEKYGEDVSGFFFIKGFGILDTHLVSNPNFYICSAIELSKGTYRFIDYKTETSIPIYAAALKQTILASVRLYKIGTDDTFISYDVACRTLDGTDITAQLAQAINGWTINYEIVKVEV